MSEEERSRAQRFRFPLHRHRFVAGRGILRDILARYLRREPTYLEFRYGSHGKPALAGEGAGGIRFNVSHSAAMALFAFARGREVGVDLEQIRPMPDAEAIACRFFSAREKAALAAVPAELREEAFFACWTRKEAFIKAAGKGLSMSLDSFDATLDPGEPARLLDTRAILTGAECCTVQQLHPGPGYVGALVFEGSGCAVRQWDWTSTLLPEEEDRAR